THLEGDVKTGLLVEARRLCLVEPAVLGLGEPAGEERDFIGGEGGVGPQDEAGRWQTRQGACQFGASAVRSAQRRPQRCRHFMLNSCADAAGSEAEFYTIHEAVRLCYALAIRVRVA